ncbi:hypothetical protein VTN02DRAFT_3742 [Thermoascus thermophilus]
MRCRSASLLFDRAVFCLRPSFCLSNPRAVLSALCSVCAPCSYFCDSREAWRATLRSSGFCFWGRSSLEATAVSSSGCSERLRLGIVLEWGGGRLINLGVWKKYLILSSSKFCFFAEKANAGPGGRQDRRSRVGFPERQARGLRTITVDGVSSQRIIVLIPVCFFPGVSMSCLMVSSGIVLSDL